MPYIWTEPDIALKYKGVVIFYTYKDEFDIRRLECHFTTDVTEQPENVFDIRDYPGYDSKRSIEDNLKAAIDDGFIRPEPDDCEGG
jgi:hypothetical protein